MPQIFLDPVVVKQNPPAEVWHPNGPLPQPTRAFGFCIDFEALLPGDLILFSSVNAGFIGKAIRKIQEIGGYNSDDASWEHAAIYIQADTICEAVRSGVKIGSIFGYMGSHRIRIRRNPKLSVDERWSLVVNAIQQRDYAYGYLSVLSLAIKAHIGFWKQSGSNVLVFPKRRVS